MDIREILQALDENDRKLWSECRTAMRKTYLTAHNKTYGIGNWQAEDDAFMDLIDIKLATLFDRAGRLVSEKSVIGDDASKIEADLDNQDKSVTEIVRNLKLKEKSNLKKLMEISTSSSLPVNEWGN